MPDDPITQFLLRFEGGPRDGQTSGSTFVDPAELPALLEIEGEVYELAMASQLPPSRHVVRGAMYKHVGRDGVRSVET